MSNAKRATVHLDPGLHRALQQKAAKTDRSISELIDKAVRESLAEDADDLAAMADRVSEPTRSFASFVSELQARGDL